jgi:hypothetical protein
VVVTLRVIEVCNLSPPTISHIPTPSFLKAEITTVLVVLVKYMKAHLI